MVCNVYMISKDMCLLTQRYKFMQLYEQSTKYIFIKGRYRCCTKSATVQDEFQSILAGLISCAGVTGRWERYVMQERHLRVRTCAGASVTCDNYDHSQLGTAAQREAKLPLTCFYLVYGQGQRHRKPPDCIWCKREQSPFSGHPSIVDEVWCWLKQQWMILYHFYTQEDVIVYVQSFKV